MTETETRV